MADHFTLSWDRLTVKARRKSQKLWFGGLKSVYEEFTILENVSGKCQSGTLLAVMGASGSGKTTLLAAVSQRLKSGVQGQLLINGTTVDSQLMSCISAFVPQHDIIVNTLTVLEHMHFMMQLSATTSAHVRQCWISSVLQDLSLCHCNDQQVLQLSGGERKRLALAAKLLTDPPILFCDEPTTGLDSYNALAVVQKLKQLTARGKLVLCSIHQPASDVFSCFDEVVLIAGGILVYHGLRSRLGIHFASTGFVCPPNYNLAEYAVQQVSTASASNLQKLTVCNTAVTGYSQQDIPPAVDILCHQKQILQATDHSISLSRPSWLVTVYWLMWRTVVDATRSKMIHGLHLIVFMVTSLTLSLFYMHVSSHTQQGIQDSRGLLFLVTTEVYFTCAYRVFDTFPAEIPVFLREKELYPPSAYYVAKLVTLVPRLILEPMVFFAVICGSNAIGGNANFSYFTLVGPLILSAYSATAYGFLLSALFESPNVAAALSVPLDLFALIFAGMYYNIRSLPLHLQWTKYLSQLYYTNEILSVLHWQDISDIECYGDGDLPCYQTGRQVMQEYGYLETDLYINIAALLLLFVVLNAIAYLAVVIRARRQPVF